MRYSTFRFIKLIVVITIAIVVGVAVVAGIAWLPVPIAAAGSGVMLLLRRRVKEVVIDERTYRIADRAGRVAFQIGTILAALAAATLLALDRSNIGALGEVGLAMAYMAAGFMMIYYLGYLYYGRKLGGEE